MKVAVAEFPLPSSSRVSCPKPPARGSVVGAGVGVSVGAGVSSVSLVVPGFVGIVGGTFVGTSVVGSVAFVGTSVGT